MLVHDIRGMLLKCEASNSESVFQKTADDYEDDLLKFKDFPDEHFGFFIELLSDARFYNKAGVWNFLLVLSTENHKLTTEHYKKISETIIKQYVNYQNEDLCLAACDFIARNYPLDEATTIFNRLKSLETSKNVELYGFVEDGRRIMRAEADRAR